MVSEIPTGHRRQWTDADCIHVVYFLRGIVPITSFGNPGVCVRVRVLRTHGKTPGALQAWRRRNGGEGRLKMARWDAHPDVRVHQAHQHLHPPASHMALPSPAELTLNLDCPALDVSVLPGR